MSLQRLDCAHCHLPKMSLTPTADLATRASLIISGFYHSKCLWSSESYCGWCRVLMNVMSTETNAQEAPEPVISKIHGRLNEWPCRTGSGNQRVHVVILAPLTSKARRTTWASFGSQGLVIVARCCGLYDAIFCRGRWYRAKNSLIVISTRFKLNRLQSLSCCQRADP